MATKKKAAPELDKIGPLKLVSLEAENILRLTAVNITVDKNGAVLIGGANESGKSSVLKSIEMLLAGGKAVKDPIHDDAEKGRIVGRFSTKLGEVVVTKTFTRKKGPVLKITVEGYAKALAGPQTIIDALLDSIALDPLKFARMDPEKRAKMLAEIMGYDSTESDKKRADLYDDRTLVNREVKTLKGAYESITHHDDAPEKKVSASEMMAELEEITTHNAAGADLERALDTATADLAAARDELTQAKMNLLESQESVDALVASQAAAIAADDDFEPKDASELRVKIKKADEINAKFLDNDNKAKARTAYLAKEKESRDLDDQIDAIDRAKKEAMEKAQENLPVKGLGISAEGVTYKGKPFEQAGSSAIIKTSTAIAMSVNKDAPIKLLLIDDAEAIDPKTMPDVLAMAAKAGFDVWAAMTRFAEGEEPSVIIEDGQVQA